MGNFCEKHPTTAENINRYLEFIDEIDDREDLTPEVKERMLGMSERAVHPLMQKQNEDIKEKTILKLADSLKNRGVGSPKKRDYHFEETPTVRDVEQLIAIERGEEVEPEERVLKPGTLNEKESEAIILDYIKNMDPEVKQKQIKLLKELAKEIEEDYDEEENMSEELLGMRKESQEAFRNWTRITSLLAAANLARCPICNSRGDELHWMCEKHEPIPIFESDKLQKERMKKVENEYKKLEGEEEK